jgi:hypothetical protein
VWRNITKGDFIMPKRRNRQQGQTPHVAEETEKEVLAAAMCLMDVMK